MKRPTWLDVYQSYFDGTAPPDRFLHALVLKGAAQPDFEDRLKASLGRLPSPGLANTLADYRALLGTEQRGVLDDFERSPEGPELTAFELIEWFNPFTTDNSIYRT